MSSKTTSQAEITRIDQVLDKHGLKKTSLRRSILLAFSNTKSTLSQADLIDILSKKNEVVDRVSIYRNLTSLKSAGVLHEVDANNYIFCSHECEKHAHLLLYCQKCQKHQEIQDHDRIEKFMTSLDSLKFFGKKQPVFLRGVCSSCS